MAAPAEVSKRRCNFRIRQFKEKCHFNIAANLTLNTMVSFVTLLIARTARIVCADRHTYIQTHTHTHTHSHTQDNYCNPLCACASRVNYAYLYWDMRMKMVSKCAVTSERSVLVKIANSNFVPTLRGFRWYPAFLWLRNS